MNIQDYSALNVGDLVSVACHGSWSVRSQGVYQVTKVNKVRVHVQRVTDGYERVFSVKHRREMKEIIGIRGSFLESIADKERRENAEQAQRKEREAWAKVEAAAKARSISELREAVAALEQLI